MTIQETMKFVFQNGLGELALIHMCYNINKLNQKYKEIHGTCDKDKAQYNIHKSSGF